jgi:hypothetical protein
MSSSNHFANVVRARLAANRVEGRKPDSLRGLARVMAGGDAARTEIYKRSLFKWMAVGSPNPNAESRALVASALGIEASELEDEDDAEAAGVVSLDDLLRRRIDVLLRERLQALQQPSP